MVKILHPFDIDVVIVLSDHLYVNSVLPENDAVFCGTLVTGQTALFTWH